MEISGKILREVEFRDRLRGYDTDEVDEFLEKVAVGIDELRSELTSVREQLAKAGRAPEAAAAPEREQRESAFDDDSIRRTLVLAQRTADLAIAEAREEATHLVEDARGQAESLVTQAQDAARHMRDEAEFEAHERLDRLAEQRDRLERDIQSLANLLGSERDRLTQALQSALGFVTESLSFSDDMARVVQDLPGRRDNSSQQPPTDTGTRNADAEVSEDAQRAVETTTEHQVPGATASQRGDVGDILDPDEALWARWATGAEVDLGTNGGNGSENADVHQFPLGGGSGNFSA